jgi:hypothetical protein
MISGAVMGMKMSRLLARAPRKSYRVRARPIIVPAVVAKIVETMAIWRLRISGSVMSGRFHKVR